MLHGSGSSATRGVGALQNCSGRARPRAGGIYIPGDENSPIAHSHSVPQHHSRHRCGLHRSAGDGEVMRSPAVKRILALAYAPLLMTGIAACGSDPAGAAGPQDGTETGPIPSATSSPDLRVRPLTAVCGNGIVDAGEQCDDGNLAAHDGCSATCTIELVTQFSFTGAAGNEVTFIASTADPALATTPMMSRGIGVTAATATDAFSASAWTTGATLDANDFYSFTVAPATGKAMNLRALQLDERRSATGIRSWSVRSSLDGFASDLAVFSVPDDTNSRTETAQLPAVFHDLTTAIEFRIFGYQSEAASGTWRIDNVALIGGVAPT